MKMAGLWDILRIPESGARLYSFATDLLQGTVIDRPNRFLVNVSVEGKNIPCHLHDPGRLLELIFPGNNVLVRRTNGIKTSHSVTASQCNDEWVLTDSRVHSELASQFLPADSRKEVKIGNHRIDFQWEDTLIEVKGCTMMVGETATFPDAPTKRGREHIEILRQHVSGGGRSALFILTFRKSARCFIPNSNTDPEFSKEFYKALNDGVEVFIPKLSFENGNILFQNFIDVCGT